MGPPSAGREKGSGRGHHRTPLQGHPPGDVVTPQRRAGRRWRTLRASILASQPTCAIRGPKCTGYATTVDHVVPIALGGDEFDPNNLRPACAACNYGLGAKLTNKRRAGKVPSAAEAERARRWAAADRRRREESCTWQPGQVCEPACNGSTLPPGCQRSYEITW
jgi:hypothetical protein